MSRPVHTIVLSEADAAAAFTLNASGLPPVVLDSYLDAAEAALPDGGDIVVPPGRFRVRKLGGRVWTKPYRLHGAGVPEAMGPAARGTVIYRAPGDSGDAPAFTWAGTGARDGGAFDIAFSEALSAWPAVDRPGGWLLRFDQTAGDVRLERVGLFGCNRGVDVFGVGRFTFADIRGNPMRRGIRVHGCHDLGEIERVHFWPYGLPAAALRTMQSQGGGVGIELLRTDGIWMDDIFLTSYWLGVSLPPFPAYTIGTTQHEPSTVIGSRKVQIGGLYTDFCASGLHVNQAGATVHVDVLKAHGEVWGSGGQAVPWGWPVLVEGGAASGGVSVGRVDASIWRDGFAMIEAGWLMIGALFGERMNRRGAATWPAVTNVGGVTSFAHAPAVDDPALRAAMRWHSGGAGVVRAPAAAWPSATAPVW